MPYPEITPQSLLSYGKIRKTHGHKGALVIAVDNELLFDLEPDFLFIEIEGIPVPFAVSEMSGTREHCITFFEGIDTLSEAERYRGARLWVARKSYEEHLERSGQLEELSLDHLLGFTIEHPTEGVIGRLQHINDNTSNVLLTIERSEGDEVLLPFVDEWILEVHPCQCRIIIDFPKELLALN